METVTDLVAARRLLKEMGYEQLQPTRVMEDNQPAIALVRDQARMEGATKHTDMRHLKLRELQADGDTGSALSLRALYVYAHRALLKQ